MTLREAAERVVAMRRTIGKLTPGVLDDLEAALYAEAATPAAEPCPKCACCTVEASQHGLCGACNIGEECESCLTMVATPAAEPGLVVERLARALAASKDNWFGGDRDSWWLAEPEGMAHDIAAEYARLRVPAPEEKPDASR